MDGEEEIWEMRITPQLQYPTHNDCFRQYHLNSSPFKVIYMLKIMSIVPVIRYY